MARFDLPQRFLLQFRALEKSLQWGPNPQRLVRQRLYNQRLSVVCNRRLAQRRQFVGPGPHIDVGPDFPEQKRPLQIPERKQLGLGFERHAHPRACSERPPNMQRVVLDIGQDM